MPSQVQRLIPLFRAIVLAGIAALLTMSVTVPMAAQNSVPPSAVQAARMPEFAKRLAHPGSRPASRSNPTPVRQGSRGGPGQGGPIYDNGPINGNTNAWPINSGYVISDTFTVGGGGGVNGMTFGAWLFPGDTLSSVEISITSEPNGGTVYFDETVAFSQSDCTGNGFGLNVCTVSSSFTGPTLNAGTYWVNLQNASVPTGDPAYWDENSGVGCTSSGCPSQASDNEVGTIPSESFTMLGSNGSPTCFEPQGNLQIVHSFTQQQGGGQTGVVIDNSGKLYGANPSGGNSRAGLAYKLSDLGGWILDPLFNFFGGSSGSEPTGVFLGPNGSLYGGAQGGIQNCGSDGSQYCGLVFNLRVRPTVCLTALCGWNENVLYRFSSESDGSGTIDVSASDSEGNLYGTTSSGGTRDAGTVFELTPSGSGWTKTTLYSFTGGNDGGTPTKVLAGNDGNLYGVTTVGGISQGGVVFQLTPSGGQWTESVLHTFGGVGGQDGYSPGYLVQDGAGNLYGIVTVFLGGSIFLLEKTGSSWAFSEDSMNHSCMPSDIPFGNLNNLSIDAAGNLYGTGYGGMEDARSLGKSSPGGVGCYYSYIFKAWHDSDGWHNQDLRFLLNQYLDSSGPLAIDTSGNLYGTTADCGTNNSGTVWRVSP